ncbi:MAG: hypothetical protein ACYTG3_15085 [Planctomycetota bacterium]|jgi:hypothetical protein
MRRLLLIPVAGTIAALVVVLLAHEPREEEPGPVFPEPPPPVLPDDDAEPPAPPPEEEKADPAEPEKKSKPEKPPEPPPPVAEYYLQLQQDGNLVELNSSRKFTDTAAVIQGLGNDKTRHRIFLSNGEGVEEAALDKLLEGLSAKFEVRKVYRAPEKEEE